MRYRAAALPPLLGERREARQHRVVDSVLGLGIVTVLPTLCLLGFPSYRPEALTLLAVAAAFFAQRYALLPLLNRRREAGDETGAKALHKLSVVIHLLQWAAVAVTLVRLAA